MDVKRCYISYLYQILYLGELEYYVLLNNIQGRRLVLSYNGNLSYNSKTLLLLTNIKNKNKEPTKKSCINFFHRVLFELRPSDIGMFSFSIHHPKNPQLKISDKSSLPRSVLLISWLLCLFTKYVTYIHITKFASADRSFHRIHLCTLLPAKFKILFQPQPVIFSKISNTTANKISHEFLINLKIKIVLFVQWTTKCCIVPNIPKDKITLGHSRCFLSIFFHFHNF